jgi:ribosomal protein S21
MAAQPSLGHRSSDAAAERSQIERQAGAGARHFEGETATRIFVRDNNVDQAIKALKGRCSASFREMKGRRFYEETVRKDHATEGARQFDARVSLRAKRRVMGG